ncbi:hypothetical protein DRN89_04045 [archaeon]|nr:MAG: hypothetical protein DRN89_04045 [archaeon]
MGKILTVELTDKVYEKLRRLATLRGVKTEELVNRLISSRSLDILAIIMSEVMKILSVEKIPYEISPELYVYSLRKVKSRLNDIFKVYPLMYLEEVKISNVLLENVDSIVIVHCGTVEISREVNEELLNKISSISHIKLLKCSRNVLNILSDRIEDVGEIEIL